MRLTHRHILYLLVSGGLEHAKASQLAALYMNSRGKPVLTTREKIAYQQLEKALNATEIL